jgi:thioesterase domain-containing protein/acyl carrier protein
VAGELCIGGVQVARGYTGKPELTAERFVPDSLGAPGSRLYRTGDLARFLPEGEVEFLGRIDQQVKVRGFRIEPGEIESVLSAHPSVREVALLAQAGPGGARLLAAVVPEPGSAAETATWREHLRRRLPEHMVPSVWVELERLPRSPSGKLDRRALGESLRGVRAAAGSLAPRDTIELELAQIAADTLGIPAVGVRDSFFSLGGHSLLAVRFLAAVRRRLGVELPLATLFQSPTVEDLAAIVRRREHATVPQIAVELQGNGAERPLFCVHPIGGTVFCYLDLARSLGPDQPFYGLQAPVEARRQGAVSIAAMAEEYLRAVRSVQPDGPLRLAGWSMGGVVAYEMACQARELGEEVECLLLLDVAAPGQPSYPRQEDGGRLLASFARDLWALGGKRLAGRDLPDGADAFGRLLQTARQQDLLPPDLTDDDVRRWFEVFAQNHAAMAAYSARPYPGRLILLRAAERGRKDGRQALGWERTARGGVEVRTIPGHHYSMLREPHVGALADAMREAMVRS